MPKGIPELRQKKQDFMNLVRSVMLSEINLAAEILLDEMKNLTDLRDHTLTDLRKMGHPYAVRFPQGTPHPDYMVHVQSENEDLRSGLRRTGVKTRSGKNEIYAEIHSDSDHTWFVLLGNGRMRPRDFVSAAIINVADNIQYNIKESWARLHDAANLEGDVLSINSLPAIVGRNPQRPNL